MKHWKINKWKIGTFINFQREVLMRIFPRRKANIGQHLGKAIREKLHDDLVESGV